MAILPNSRGFVLPMVAILLLSLTMLFTILLKTGGKLNPVLSRYKSDFEAFYRAESAVLLHLQGFPSDYYPELPRVQVEPFGPWEKICTISGTEKSDKDFCLVAGTEPHNVSFWEWSNGVSNYRSDLEKRILESTSGKELYGNRRYFQGDSLMSGAIHQGDLEIGFSDSVQSASFWVEGTVLVRGHAHFDTLRLYALGDVVFQGEMSVGYLELFTQGGFRAEGEASFRGMVLASSFRMKDHARSLFPTAVVATWDESYENETAQSSEGEPDGVLFPAFIEGRRKIWGRL